jgi:putative transposase
MSNYRRVYLPGGMYFFTVVTFRRQCFLIDDDVRAALREGIQFTRQTKPFEIVAWVLLPDHLNCIWRLPQDDTDFSSRWSIIKRIVTQRCGGTFESSALVERTATQATIRYAFGNIASFDKALLSAVEGLRTGLGSFDP